MSVRQNQVADAPDANMDVGALGSPTGEPMASPTLSSDVPPITRTLVASIRASLSELTQETSSAKWAPSDGALKSIFKQKASARHAARPVTARAPQSTHCACTTCLNSASRRWTGLPRRRATSSRWCCTISPSSTPRAHSPHRWVRTSSEWTATRSPARERRSQQF